jgi:thioredoxin reductase (NADPH)
MPEVCEHLEKLEAEARKPVAPSGHGCQECLEGGGDWVHLRLCMACGHVGCCDDSPSKHATKHAHKTHHPVIRSYEPGEEWAYCYSDDQMIDGVTALPGEAAPRHYSAPGASHP